MKRLALVLALVAVGACSKEEKAAQTPADTSHAMQMTDTSHAMMSDTTHMMMADTVKKVAPAAPAAKPAAKKKKP